MEKNFNMKLKKIIILLGLMLLLTNNTNLLADDHFVWDKNIGIYTGLNINMHQPNFALDGSIPLPFETNKSSLTGFLGLEFNAPIIDIMSITGRINYNVASVKELEGRCPEFFSTLDIYLDYVDINPSIKLYNIIPSDNLRCLYFTGGINIGVPIKNKYNYVLENAFYGLFKKSDDIPDASMRMALNVGIGYIINLTDKLYLMPELSYQIPFNKVSSNTHWDSWSVPQLRLGVSLTYDFFSGNKETSKKVDEEKPFFVEMENINYYNKVGEKQDAKNIVLEEIEYGELFPLVPYIFYEKNETEIANEYRSENHSLAGVINDDISNILPNEAIEINYRTVDIVGKRLEKNKDAIVTLTGTVDGKTETSIDISKGRAESIKRYILNNYNVEEERVKVEASMLPKKPSAQNVEDGIEENRRVEISSNSKDILEPIFIKGERQRIATPEVVEFVPMVVADSVTLWTLEIMQTDRIIKTISGVKVEPVRWHIATNELVASQIPVDYVYTIFYNDESTKTTGSIPVEFITFSKKKTIEQADKSINKYSLILFEFDKYDISDENAQIIDKYVIPNIKYKSNIEIFGFTDRIGNSNYNKKLAKSRAEAVKNYILTKNKNVNIKTYGVDAADAPFDNNSAIGRQLSRTVQIFLITPKE